MKPRQIIITAIAIGIVVVAVIGSEFLASQKKDPSKRPEVERTPLVKVNEVENTTVQAGISIDGKTEASRKLEIFAEVNGHLLKSARSFKEGIRFKQGEALLILDDEEAKLALLSAKSNLQNMMTQILPDLKLDYPESYGQWKKYLDKFEVNKSIQPLPEPVSDREKYFISGKNIYSQYYSIKSQEERLSKYVIRAPFSGVLTQALVDPGTLIRAGQKLGEFIDPSVYELNANISIANLDYINIGDTVTLYSEDIKGTWKGKVVRINDKIDPQTQTVIVFVEVSGPGMKQGMYLHGDIAARKVENATLVKRSLISDRSQVFVVKDGRLVWTKVDVIQVSGDEAVVKGLENGDLILAANMPSAREGMEIQIDRQP